MIIEKIIQFYYWIQDWFQGKPLLGGLRSPKWAAVRKEYLRKFPTCAVCGRKAGLIRPLNVHHCVMFSVDKSLELSPDNLITLCPEHHLFVGHLMNFKSFNKNVRVDSELWRNKILNRPK